MNHSKGKAAVKAGRGLDFKKIRPLLKQALEEDGAWTDRTTYATTPSRFPARGEIIAKSEGVLAGLPVVTETFRLLDKQIRLKALVQEGARVRRGMKVAELRGFARPLLSGERVSLNLMSRLSGIATLTRQFASKIKGPRLYDTRKTTPLWRLLERYAVRVGGGQNHRFNLGGHVLIKDKGEFIEVEVESFDQASDALRAGADILLVDNASPKTFDRILRLVRGKMQVEVSGGLTLRNIGQYSRLPVERFSSGSLTHSAPSLDFSIEFYPLK